MTRPGTGRLIAAGLALLAVIFLVLTWSLSRNVSTTLVVFAVLVGIAVIGGSVSSNRTRPEALTNELAIAERLQALRSGASSFYAIWSGAYDEVEVEQYFDLEQRALSSNGTLRISRVINPTVIPAKHYNLLQSIRSQFGPRFLLYEDATIHSFELYVAEYPKGRDSVAMVVVNDTLNKRPKVGLVLDPGRNPRLVGAVAAVKEWFEAIRRHLPVFDPVAIERWDHIAHRYTRFVTQNVNNIAFLEAFAEEECRRLGDHLTSIAEHAHYVTLVEVGCGDGRALLRYVPVRLADKAAYVIGLDYAPAMILAAEGELVGRRRNVEQQLPGTRTLLQKTGFFTLNASNMRRHFDDGRLSEYELLRATATETAPLEIDHSTFAASRKVFCCLLNTIGVIEPYARRVAIVESMLAALGLDDRLVLSVFAADAFEQHARELYHGLEAMLATRVRDQHFDVGRTTFCVDGTPGYYSHWFAESEIRDLLTTAMTPLMRQGRAFDAPVIEPMACGGHFVMVRRAG